MSYNDIKTMQDVLISKGLSFEDSKNLIENNQEIFNYSPEQVNNKLSVIFNENGVYAIIFCDGNKLYWSTKSLGNFDKLFKENPNVDYIIGTVLENLNRDKLNMYSGPKNTLEQKMIIYKDISKGAPGYNIK